MCLSQAAEGAAQEFHSLAKKLYGEEHSVVASALNNLGLVYKVRAVFVCTIQRLEEWRSRPFP